MLWKVMVCLSSGGGDLMEEDRDVVSSRRLSGGCLGPVCWVKRSVGGLLVYGTDKMECRCSIG